MKIDELNNAIRLKIIELDAATELSKSNAEVMKIYKELKELKYQLVQEENLVNRQQDFDLV